jgi:hypothetical protein
MSIWLEDKIREAVLALRWRQVGNGPDPRYFVDAPPESLQLESSTASYLAHFITEHVAVDNVDRQKPDLVDEELDKYSLEIIASYLEDRGYTVNSPD